MPASPHAAATVATDADPPIVPGRRPSGFGTTLSGAPASIEAEPASPLAASAFDVCHVGVVLRALLFVHAVVAVGVSFTAAGLQGWLAGVVNGSGVALPAVLMWLLAACGLKGPLGALPKPGQWLAATALGALGGAFGSALAWLLSGDASGAPAWRAPALAGAGLAAVLLHWLNLRSRARMPADTTARLAELQSRIRPHFLFNTLNTALALVRLDPARAEGVLEDLAELFRVAIGDTSEAVTLADEIELARRYLAIEQIRFGSRLNVVWELDPAADAARVPPLLLQPLVENAVRHGVEQAAAGGMIRVRTQVRLGRAVVGIVNSVPLAASQPGHGMALRNVQERLRLMHDVGATFETQQRDGVFRVRIVIPL